MAVNRKRIVLGVLIAAGIVFAVLLTFIVFVIWKYLHKQRRSKQEGLLAYDEEALDQFNPELFNVPKDVPINCRTVLGQEPVKYERIPPPPLPGTTALRKLQRQPSRHSMLIHGESMMSLKSECDEQFLFGSSPASASEEDDQVFQQPTELKTIGSRKRSQFGQNRRKSIALRGYSITEDMFASSLGRLNEGVSGNRSRSLERLPKTKADDLKKSFADVVQPLKVKDQPILLGLQPKGIYKRDHGNSLQQRGLYKRGGKIIFKTKYLENKKELEVHILKAFDLTTTRDMTEITPFVRICLLPGKKQKQDTKHKKQPTKEPFFNEKIIFQGLKRDELASLKLNIKVCNHSRVKKKEVLGEAELALSSIDLLKEKSFCVTLFQQRYEVTSASISISVCHEATEAKLVALIHETHLPKSGKLTMHPNPYATVSLYKNDTVIDKKQTPLKRLTTNPFYEERFEFAVYTTTAEDLGIYSLDVTLRHSSYVGKGNAIGHVVLSLNSSQKTAEDQWKAAVDLPHKYHKAVHALIDPDEL